MGSGASRNDPCPCGSGRKFKKCCGVPKPAPLTDRIVEFALGVTPRDEVEAAMEEFGETSAAMRDPRRSGLFLDWFISGRRRGGRTLLERFEVERGASLSEPDRLALAKHKATRVGVYEVAAVRPGKGLRLKDVFTGAEVEVADVSASRQAAVHDVVSARLRWSDSPPSLWGEAVVFGPLEREELKFDLQAAYGEAKVHDPALTLEAFVNSATPLLKRLQARYLSKRSVSVGVTPLGPAREPGGKDGLLARSILAHGESWPDEPVPALGNRTPRQAAEDPQGRAFLGDLLKEYERNSARLPAGDRLELLMNAPAIAWMRRALGLPVPRKLSAALRRLDAAAGRGA